jgi:hypothetical protein
MQILLIHAAVFALVGAMVVVAALSRIVFQHAVGMLRHIVSQGTSLSPASNSSGMVFVHRLPGRTRPAHHFGELQS